MIIRNFILKLRLYKHKKLVQQNSILQGSNHHFSILSDVTLTDGARKENVIIENGAWVLGQIMVQHQGKFKMGEFSKIGISTKILCVDKIEIGAYTAIANDTTICDNNNHPLSPSYRKKMRLTGEGASMRYWRYSTHAPIIIGQNCWIGSNVRICKGVTIGDNSIVAACSVVTKDVPANCIVAGNPAKVVKTDIDKIPEPQFP